MLHGASEYERLVSYSLSFDEIREEAVLGLDVEKAMTTLLDR